MTLIDLNLSKSKWDSYVFSNVIFKNKKRTHADLYDPVKKS